MSSQYTGDLGTELNSTWTYSLRSGQLRIRHFEGHIDWLSNKANEILDKKNAGDPTEAKFISYEFSQPDPSGYGRMDVTYQEDPLDNWYFDGSDGLQSLWLKQSVVAMENFWSANVLTENYIAWMRQAFQSGLKVFSTFDVMFSASTNYQIVYNDSSPEYQSIQKSLYKSLVMGIEYFPSSQVIIRRELFLPDPSFLNTPYGTNMYLGEVGSAYTFTALTNRYTINPAVLYLMPTTWYYIYKTPSSAPAGNGKYLVRQEFWASQAVVAWINPIILT